MRSMIFLLALLLVGCKSQREVATQKSLALDSVARSEHHRSISMIDSVICFSSFDFDTLEVLVERPTTYADKPETIRLKAVKGRVIDRRMLNHYQVENYNRLDTVSYKKSAVESSTEHSATTRLFNPPDGTAVSVITIVVVGILVYLFLRKK